MKLNEGGRETGKKRKTEDFIKRFVCCICLPRSATREGVEDRPIVVWLPRNSQIVCRFVKNQRTDRPDRRANEWMDGGRNRTVVEERPPVPMFPEQWNERSRGI